MAGVSNTIIGFINFIFSIFGLILISAGLYIFTHGNSSHCQKLIQNPLLIIGFFVLVVSLLGLAGSYWKDNSLLITYLFIIFFLIVGLIALTIFSFLVFREGGSGSGSGSDKAVSAGLGFKEYRLENFSEFLQKYGVNTKNWVHIKSCLIDSHICNNLTNEEIDFYKMKLSPVQSGCCMPPTFCDLEFKSPTFWTVPKSSGFKVINNTDCTAWNNNQNLLCYDCNSCKAGFLASLSDEYRVLVVYNILIILFLILVYFIGCCARRSNKYRYVKYSPYITA